MAYIILNKNNFFHNLDIIAKKTKSKDKIALVLKDNAYGHGILEIASMAKEYGIQRAVVKSFEEAQKIQAHFAYILVLAGIPQEKNTKISYVINDMQSIDSFEKGTRVELKVDTGMHRNGISVDELENALKLIQEQELHLEAVCTHHRSADELSSEWFWQKEHFENIKKRVHAYGYEKIRFHSANSAALFREQDFSEDMVRVGIAVYGCLELPPVFLDTDLKPVLSVYAEKISSRKMTRGEAIGYGASFRIDEACTVSNYDFGYGDGFLRSCSSQYIAPKGFQLVGRISMDNCSFISKEQELLIFDDARDAAKYADTIAYEVLTSLKANLERRVI